MNLLASEVSANLGKDGITILIGVVVVFTMLLLLTGVFKAFGLVMSGTGKKQDADEAAPVAAPAAAPAVAPVAAPIVGNTETVRTTPEVQNGIPAETVAVISAAVASVAPAGSQYAVRGIRKV